MLHLNYIRCHLASEGIMSHDVMLSRCVCAHPPSHLYHISPARHRHSLGGEGNALYLVLSSLHVITALATKPSDQNCTTTDVKHYTGTAEALKKWYGL